MTDVRSKTQFIQMFVADKHQNQYISYLIQDEIMPQILKCQEIWCSGSTDSLWSFS